MHHRRIRIAVTSAAAVGLLTGGIAGAAVASPHVSRAHQATAVPAFKATIRNNKLTLTGPSSVPEGRVNFSFHAVGNEYEMFAASFKNGYTLADFRKDIKAVFSNEGQNGVNRTGRRHLRRLIRHTVGYGGFDAVSKQRESGSFLFNRPGTVYVWNDTNALPRQVHKIRVTTAKGVQGLPHTSATVTQLTKRRFGGSKNLPAKGTIKVHNKSTESPHFLSLLHVKEGTTRKQIEDYLQSGSQNPPPWARPGSAGTDVLTTNEAQTLTYSLPKGEYAELCFFPDPKTGMPHALMGMIGIVHLK